MNTTTSPSSSSSPAAGALDGLRVLDLSRVLAGPWCTQNLADLGADVVKIEKPGAGDDTRHWGPPFFPDEHGQPTDEACYFAACNRNKRSVTVDMATPEGQQLIRQLASSSDVVVENFKTGGLARYGLDYASLSALNPRLVYCSVPGFGHTGPYAQRAGGATAPRPAGPGPAHGRSAARTAGAGGREAAGAAGPGRDLKPQSGGAIL